MGISLSLARPLFLAIFLLGATGAAQTTLKLSFTSNDSEKALLGRAACSTLTQLSIRWEFSNRSGRIVCSPGLRVWATGASSCGTELTSEDINLFSINQTELLAATAIATPNVTLSHWPAFTEEKPCGADNIRVEHRICGLVLLSDTYGNCGANNQEKVSSSPISVVYKTTPPPAPVIEKAEGYDGQMTVHFSAFGDDLAKLMLFGRRSDETEYTPMGEVEFTSSFSPSAIHYSGVENNVPYTFFVKSIDLAGNESPNSAEAEGVSVHTDGFWDIYIDGGGAAGGCNTAGGGPLAWGLTLALWGLCISQRSRLW